MTKDKLTKVLLVILALLTIQLNVFAQSGSGLIGYWPFSGNANDASGNNLNGINNGATLIADRNGNANSAYYFNGTSSVITVPHDQMLNAYPLTINFWFKTTQSTVGGNTKGNSFITKYQTGTNDGGYKIETSNGHRIAPTYCTTGSFGRCNGGMTFDFDGNWHMATVVFSIDTITTNNIIVLNTTIYVDNILKNSSNGVVGSIQATTNTRDLLFGKSDNSNPFFFDGGLDDISIWAKPLTHSERTGLFNGTANISGINDERTETMGSVHPNPATDQITINTKSTQNTPYSILDVTGRVVSEGKLESGSTTVSIADLQKGMYLVKIGDGQKQQLNKMLKL